MFLNQRLERNGVKQFQSRADYFRSYNQKPHRKEYLKEYSKVRRLVAKYNPAYQDKRKDDRHKLTNQNRYRIKILTQELAKKGWIEINKAKSKENPSSSPFFFFNVVSVDKKSPQTYSKYKSMFFLCVREGGGHQQKQNDYLFSYLVQKEGKILSELLTKKPLLFKKGLEEIEKESLAVQEHWTKKDFIPTLNQIPRERGWNLDCYSQNWDLSALLLKYKEAGGKNKLVLDFDHYKKSEDGEYLMSEKQRKEIDVVIDYLINYWKLPWYEVSKSGARKLHLNIDELPSKSKLWWKLLVIGDILGKGSQTTLLVSKNRSIEFSKWSKNGTELPEIELENWEQDLAKFSLSSCDKGMAMIRDYKEIKRQQNHFLVSDKNYLRKHNFFSTSATLKKELSYYGTRTVRPLKIFTPQRVEKLSSLGGSRDSFYYQVPYLDPVSQRIESFLIDRGWREKEFRRVTEWNCSSSLLLRAGERVDFLVRVGS